MPILSSIMSGGTMLSVSWYVGYGEREEPDDIADENPGDLGTINMTVEGVEKGSSRSRISRGDGGKVRLKKGKVKRVEKI
jgi:hypothetical protein